MKVYEVDYHRYNVTMKMGNNEVLVASLRGQLIGTDYVYLTMEFPYNESSETRISLDKYMGVDLVDIIKRIVSKKMYKMQQDILADIKNIEYDEDSQYGKYDTIDNFCYGKVYANRINNKENE